METTLELRLAKMEMQLDSLQRLVEQRLAPEKREQKKGWQAIVGTFADDPLYDEAMRLGREWRVSDQGDPAVETP